MSNETIITVIGNLTADPELRYTQNGLAVVNFTVASTPRIYDRQASEFKDGEALFMRCNAWRDMAENVTQSLAKGSRVIVVGELKQRSYETKEGEKRTSMELEVQEVAPSLRYHVARPYKKDQAPQQGGAQQGLPPASQGFPSAPNPADEPWAQQRPAAPQQGYAQQPQQSPAQTYQQAVIPPGQAQQGNWNTPGAYGDDTPF